MAPRPGRPSELRDPLRARAEIESEQPAPRALELYVRPRLDYLGEPWREVARGAGVRVADLVDLTRQLDCRRDRDRDHAAEGGAMIQIRGIAQQCSPPEAAQLERARHGDLYHRAQLRSHHAVVHEQRARSQHAALRADIDDRAVRRAAPARAHPARGNDSRAPTVAAFESGPSKGAFNAGQAAGPPGGAERELLQPRGTDAVRHAIMACFHAELYR